MNCPTESGEKLDRGRAGWIDWTGKAGVGAVAGGAAAAAGFSWVRVWRRMSKRLNGGEIGFDRTVRT